MMTENDFKRKDLDKGFFWPSREYFRQLDAAYMEQREYIRQLERGKFYQQNSKEWGEAWTRLNIQMGELQREKIQEAAEKDAEIAELKAELSRKDKEIEYLQQQVDDYEQSEKPESNRKRNGQTGRFVTDIPKKDKMWRAYELSGKGFSTAQIARQLNVSYETAKRYIREESSRRAQIWGEPENNAAE